MPEQSVSHQSSMEESEQQIINDQKGECCYEKYRYNFSGILRSRTGI